MTAEESAAEYIYRVEERLGILCGDEDPTIEQWQLADAEARAAMRRLDGEAAFEEFRKLRF